MKLQFRAQRHKKMIKNGDKWTMKVVVVESNFFSFKRQN